MRRLVLLCAAAWSACDPPAEPPPAETLEPASQPSGEPAASPSVPDQAALAEIVAAAPTGAPSTTAPDGGTLVGTDSGAPADQSLPEPPGPEATAKIRGEGMTILAPLSSPAIERAAREQIYWRLGQACKAPGGGSPRPESIRLTFAIRVDGTVDPATVRSSALDPGSEPIAECVLREFASLPFRGPAAIRGTTGQVDILWPSVD